MSFRTNARKFAGAAAIAAVAGAVTLVGTSPAQAATSYFRINNFNSHHALTATSAFDRASVVQSSISSANLRQQWAIRANQGTAALTYVLRQKINAGGSLVEGCLDLPRDVDRAQQLAGEVLVVRPCDGSNSQRWLDVNTNSSQGTANLENKLSLMKIDVDNNRPLDSGAVAIQNNVSQPSQKFFRVFVTSA
jgi:hypothetical protein